MHTPTKIVAACIILVTSWVIATPSASKAPEPVVATVVEQTTTTTTTTTTAPPPSNAVCGQWWSLAAQAGFTESMLSSLDQIIYRESRCLPDQVNLDDPNGGSHGLTQINGFWCKPSRWYPLGYLQTFGVLTECADLYNPEINLRAAYALVQYSIEVGLCPWVQWAWYEGCD